MTEQQAADRVAAAALGHPSVLRLDGGAHGVIATPLPGRRVTGVRIRDEGTEIGVVLGLDRPLPEIVAELRAAAERAGAPGPVDITVVDVEQAGAR
ncbi:hypothetical protein [Saccharopolyspora taberi]|uniref:Asp23/Gls24 family envelope stress response protein n=1 Tax=Saccharopolyspora taberi TaxID=60895 RepID=A0ABN3VFR2_9PSEU